MQSLVTSVDPLVSLAGVLFAMGVCFDTVFSKEFKDSVWKLFITSDAKTGWMAVVSDFSTFFVNDLLTYQNRRVFVLKSISLSAFFYACIVVFEAQYYRGATEDIQRGFFEAVIQLYTPALFVLVAQVSFDVLSAFISVLFLRLIPLTKSVASIILILLSDVLVTGIMWSAFFGLALSLHVAIADFQSRTSTVGVVLNNVSGLADLFSKDTKNPARGGTFVKGTVFSTFSGASMPLGNNNIVFLYSNISDRDELARDLFAAISYDSRLTGSAVLVRNFQHLNTIYASDFVVSDVVKFRDVPRLWTSIYDMTCSP